MVDIHPATAENSLVRKKEERKKDRRRNHRMKI